ncbi:MAG: muconate/chloromuconate family cycloisomerase [Erythrobacter sp.]|uniref:muconate/chloromuconate family cycloisomerase n=1 Tax=Erythrobacter sp. TaxID=1042 RepID=UPI00262DABBD|nr:muconate/chloromuconate family cycloisomerase [Erythrobacter sp.]MDJ0979711.1 muconate/chloromuconate family cycloisomerase [Erythrobacter sp.]
MSGHAIHSVETIIVDLPLRRVQRFAAIGADATAVVLILVRTDTGLTGVGECCTPSGPWWSGESVESIKLMIDDHIAPHIIGKNVFDVRGIFQTVNRKLFGNAFAKAGVEMALVDLQGKIAGVPAHDLLGGKQRTSMPCSWPLATGDADLEIEEAHSWIEKGMFNLFKLKMGFLPAEDDVERACAIARALEGKASVRADPNESWDEATCKWALPRLADAGIAMIEQPLARWNLAGSARMTRATQAAIMLDESVSSMQDMIEIGKLHAADAVSLKVMKHGGLYASRRIADLALASGVSLYMGTFLECSVGTAASMQLAVTLETLPFGGELSGANLVSEDIATRCARYENFELQLEEGVGLAVEIDDDKVKALRRDRTYSVHPVAAAR